MTERLNDEQLMKHLAQGDNKAAGVLYDRYYKNVYGYFVRMTHDADASRDLTQNVFLKIIRYSQSWKEDRVFVHWLFRIARNVMVDYFRGARKFYDLNDEPELVQRDRDDSLREMETRESIDFLLDAMNKLSPGYRELIELNRFQGFSYKEIADTISSNENAVKVKTFRAIQKLKEIYTQIIME
ncbi:MAG TPA: RNA polymerase sigma factor [Prolixibacteraceae bacterium]|jgi:RNA polymerase sigma-70 factor (ECF subfamily)